MVIFWNEDKNRKLRTERGIGFEDIVEKIVCGQVLDILEHRTRKNQKIFVIMLNGRVFAVPFVFTNDEDIFLKTIYPSRKPQRRYGKTRDPDPS